jgi:iron complex transport system substrate-binding protein
MEYKDQLQRTVSFSKKPTRIVSLVPSQTELLVDLGLENELVGITKFCLHPSRLRKEKTIVGGTKNINIDKIRQLNPDIIICNKEENTKEIINTLKVIAPIWISDIYSIDDSIQMILQLGEIFNAEIKANKISLKIKKEQDLFLNYIQNKEKKTCAYLIWKNPYMIAGRNTFINELLQLNNFENLLKDKDSRYPEVDLKDLKNIDLILLATEPYPFKEKDRKEIEKKLNVKVILVDGEYFSWYGSRLIKSFKYFKTLH